MKRHQCSQEVFACAKICPCSCAHTVTHIVRHLIATLRDNKNSLFAYTYRVRTHRKKHQEKRQEKEESSPNWRPAAKIDRTFNTVLDIEVYLFSSSEFPCGTLVGHDKAME